MALVLLVSAGLMIRTFQALRTVEPGLPTRNNSKPCGFPFRSSSSRSPNGLRRTQNDILDKLAAIPGVTSAALRQRDAHGRDGRPTGTLVVEEGKTIRPGEIPPLRIFKYVSPGFFHTAGTRLIAGRDYTWTDLYDRRPVAIVSENLARELWGSPSARWASVSARTALRRRCGK